MRTRTCTATCIGDRTENEDRVAALSRNGWDMLVVADGMGGHKLGGEAAEAAVERFIDAFLMQDPASDPKRFLDETTQAAHEAVFRLGHDMDVEDRPRTTMVAALVSDGKAWFAHLGDSRAYLLRGSEVGWRTRDHSHVEDLIAVGEISEDEGFEHPLRNLVERCCGGEPGPVRPGFHGPLRLQDRDVLLLCSDGFWDGIDMREVATLLATAEDFPSLLAELAVEACELHAPMADNATVAALRLETQGK